MTLTENVQFVAFAESVPPLRDMEVEPAVALMVWPVIVPLVHDGVVSPLGVLITKPAGRLSVKPTPVKTLALGLVNVKVRVLAFPWGTEVGEKALDNVGGTGRGHPVITTLSRFSAFVLSFAPAALMKNRVREVPVVAAVWLKPVVQALPFEAAYPVPEAHEGAPEIDVSV